MERKHFKKGILISAIFYLIGILISYFVYLKYGIYPHGPSAWMGVILIWLGMGIIWLLLNFMIYAQETDNLTNKGQLLVNAIVVGIFFIGVLGLIVYVKWIN